MSPSRNWPTLPPTAGHPARLRWQTCLPSMPQRPRAHGSPTAPIGGGSSQPWATDISQRYGRRDCGRSCRHEGLGEGSGQQPPRRVRPGELRWHTGAFFRLAPEDGYIIRSPMDGIEKPGRLPSRRRFLTDAEVAEIYEVTANGGDDRYPTCCSCGSTSKQGHVKRPWA